MQLYSLDTLLKSKLFKGKKLIERGGVPMISIKNGKVHTIANGILEKATILINEGKIVEIGKNVHTPNEAEVIDAAGCWVTPGLIDAHSHISLFNLPMTTPSVLDGNEKTNPVTAHIRAIDALNPDDIAIKKVREAGFTTVYTGPGSTNVIAGTGLAIKLRGRTALEMAIPGTEHMKMALGENPKRVYGIEQKNMPMTRMGTAAILRNALFDALNYSKKLEMAKDDPSKAPEPDFKLEALVKVVRGEQKARIHCHRADDIITAIRIAEEFNLDYSLEHATEGYKVADIIAEKNITCVAGPLLLDPIKEEVWRLKQETPAILTKAGVKVCLSADATLRTAWLPMEIGLLLRRGLSEEAAFKGVTIYPAQLLGIENRLGSIEVGKDADIAIFDGHPFSNMTLCRATIIDGVIYHNTL